MTTRNEPSPPTVGVRPSASVRNDVAVDGPAMLDWTVLAEQLGFDTVFVGERTISAASGLDDQPVYEASLLEPFVLLAAMAGRTSRIRLATLVTVLPFRHPVYVAKTTASLDMVSQGRLALEVGGGWNTTELDLFGIPHGRRGHVVKEALDIVRRLWTGAPVTHSGSWSLQDIAIAPKAVQRPGPPIWMASFSPDDPHLWTGGIGRPQEHALSRVGRLADARIPLTYSTRYRTHMSAAHLARAAETVEMGARAADRSAPEFLYGHWVAVVRSEADRRACEAAMRQFFPGTFQDAQRIYLIGTPDEIIERIREQTAMLSHVHGYLLTLILPTREQLEAVARDIRPVLSNGIR
jgi:alkanesulfonate monooxygenase SsuD/methylene tetrahydromethanopterin reductase-like flavin-dependent oxidoreductase (luciferase family)